VAVLGVDYNEHQHAVYAQGRALSAAQLAIIVEALARNLPRQRPLVIADVGAGVGRLSPSVADEFGGPVYGIEPAVKMREQAQRNAGHPHVQYLSGSAEEIPLRDAVCDAAFLWFVWHHVADQARAAAELGRVVRPGGALLVRTNCADTPDQWWFEHFPTARTVDAAPQTRDAFVETLTRAGWSLESVDTVFAGSTYGRDLNMLRLRAVSTLERIPEHEFSAGLASVERAVRGREDETVTSPGDLFVFRC
jgi:ubiquinone/menaquinone biosynthesis C-methylase UbiE